jgi:hypothetical protein
VDNAKIIFRKLIINVSFLDRIDVDLRASVLAVLNLPFLVHTHPFGLHYSKKFVSLQTFAFCLHLFLIRPRKSFCASSVTSFWVFLLSFYLVACKKDVMITCV